MNVSLTKYGDFYEGEIAYIENVENFSSKGRIYWLNTKKTKSRRITLISYLLGLEVTPEGTIHMTSREIKCLRWLDSIKKQLYILLGSVSLCLTVILFIGSARSLTQGLKNPSSFTNTGSSISKESTQR